MNSRFMGVLAFATGLMLPCASVAQVVSPVSMSSADSAAIVDQLQNQERVDEFKAKFWSQEPITQQDYYVQERQDRRLQARISAGEPVSRDELDQALKRVNTDY